MLRARFEDLVTEPEHSLASICRHAGLEYQPKMLAADGFEPPSSSRSQHRLVGLPADPRRAEAWRESLSGREIEIFESVAADLLAYLGYEPVYGERARPPRRAERLRFAVRDLWRPQILFPIRRRLRA